MSGPLNESPRDLLVPASCFGLCRPRWPLPVHLATLAWVAVAAVVAWSLAAGSSGTAQLLLVLLAVGLAITLVVSVVRVLIIRPQVTARAPLPITVHVERSAHGDLLVLTAMDGRAWQAHAGDLALRWPRLARRSRPAWAIQVRRLNDPADHPVPDGRRRVIAGELIFPRWSRTVGLVLHRRHITSDALPELPTEDGSDLELSKRWQRYFNYVDFVDHSDCLTIYMMRSRLTPQATPAASDPSHLSEEAQAELEETTSLQGALELLQVKVQRGDDDAADTMQLFRSIAQADAEGKVVDPRRRAHLADLLRNEPPEPGLDDLSHVS